MNHNNNLAARMYIHFPSFNARGLERLKSGAELTEPI